MAKDKELRSKCHKARVVKHFHHPENPETYYEYYACQKCNKKCEVEKISEFPWCGNSRRWLTTVFVFLPSKSCPNESEKDCGWEKCAYFQWKEDTLYLRQKREMMKLYGMDSIIRSKKQYEELENDL